MRCPKPWSDKDSGLASIKSGLAALRGFDVAYDRVGSKRESAIFRLMSASTSCGHAAALALVRVVPIGDLSILFDNLVCSCEQCRRHSEAEHPGRWNVNDQLELGRLHDRQIRRFRTLENAAGVNAHVVIRVP
jgi:hypothetical protein